MQSGRLCWSVGAGVACRQMQILSNPDLGTGVGHVYLELLDCTATLGQVLPACAALLSPGTLPPHTAPHPALVLCPSAQPGVYYLAEYLRPWASWLSSFWTPSFASVTTPPQASLCLLPDSSDSIGFCTCYLLVIDCLCQWLSAQGGAERCACSSRYGCPNSAFLFRSEAWPSALRGRKSEDFMSHCSLFFIVTDCACSLLRH